jgi:hypothetical protein
VVTSDKHSLEKRMPSGIDVPGERSSHVATCRADRSQLVDIGSLSPYSANFLRLPAQTKGAAREVKYGGDLGQGLSLSVSHTPIVPILRPSMVVTGVVAISITRYGL